MKKLSMILPLTLIVCFMVGCQDKEEANEFLNSYLPRFNEQFMRAARKEGDLHRPIPEEMNLREILCIKGNRTINDGCIIK